MICGTQRTTCIFKCANAPKKKEKDIGGNEP